MTAIDTVDVELGERRYAIRVGSGLLARAGEELVAIAGGRRVIVVADAAVAALHLMTLRAALAPVVGRIDVFEVAAGEASKSFATFERLAEDILAAGIDRGTVILAFGGGVIGDLAGFVAATALRGLDYVQLPTTLLAQVDSSVGGKTGINTRHGKNLIGAFHQPKAVLIDTDLLDTLPRRELLAGYAEVVKYGAIGDYAFFEWLETNGRTLIDGDADARRQAIVTACRAKAAVVAEDERESAGGRRALLNFGHTFAHALEAMAGYNGSLLHGEAVAAGMALAGRLSTRVGLCDGQDVERLIAHLDSLGLPTSLKTVDPDGHWAADAMMAHMLKDKKARDGRVVFVLLDRLGAARVVNDIDPAHPRALLARAQAA
ncbi:MAG: 3-dehydroquinate synthase [Alphaproteobacteria bacterium]|nr:3-dehydroquinate synthase [Alphaproteobacteria bacterium]